MSEDTPKNSNADEDIHVFDLGSGRGRKDAAALLESLFGSPSSPAGTDFREAVASSIKDTIRDLKRKQQTAAIDKLPPLTHDDVKYLMNPSKHRVGDAVRWRAGKEYMNLPKPGQVVYVTRVFPEREADGHLENIALAVRMPCNGPDCTPEGHIVEICADGRYFESAE